MIRTHRREPGKVAELANEAIALCTEYGFREFLIWGTWHSGWAAFHQDAREAGLARMTQAMEEFRSELGAPGQSLSIAKVAEAHGLMGRISEGETLVSTGLALAHRGNEAFAESELYRVEGELRLAGSEFDEIGSEACFRRAIEVAQRQTAKWFELRATISLARLLRDTSRRDEARTTLAEIYSWFTEGFDSADLKDAKALLEEPSN